LSRRVYAVIALFVLAVVAWVVVSNVKVFLLAAGLMRDMALVGLLAGAMWAVGQRVRRFAGDISRGLESFLTSVGIGATCYALFIFMIGISGLLYMPVILLSVAVGLLPGVGDFANAVKTIGQEDANGSSINITYSEMSLLAVLLASGMVTFVAVLIPEKFYDALYYHDAFGALYLIRHGIDVFPYAVHNAMPSNVDLLYIPLLGFGGASTVKLAHFLFWVGSCLWIYSMGGRWSGRTAGICGMVVFAALPGVGAMAGVGAVDLGVCFFTLGAIALLARWIFAGEGRGSLISSAIMLGMAVGSKYSALAAAVVMAVGVIAGAIRRGGISRGSAACVFSYGAVSIALASPWYVRNLIVWGNPIYPALEKAGTPGMFAFMNLKHDSEPLYGWVATLWKLPADILLNRGAFGAGADLWPCAVLIFAGFVWALTRKGFPRWSSLAILLLYLLWSRAVLVVRYFYPGLALGSVLAGGLLMPKDRNRYLSALVLIGLVAMSFIGIRRLAGFHEMYYGGTFSYVSGNVSAGGFLAKHAPHTLAAKWIRENTTPSGTKLLFVGETRGYYFRRNYEPVGAYDRHPLKGWIGISPDAVSLKNLLKSKGFTHLIYNPSEMERLNKSYKHCTFTGEEKEVFEGLLEKSRLVAEGAGMKIYLLE